LGRILRDLLLATSVLASACTTARTTHTPRTAQEQLLVSTAVDRALESVEFASFAGRKVYLEEKYLDGIDKNYVLWSIRRRLLAAGVVLTSKIEDADVVVEASSGCIGTDSAEMFVGTTKADLPTPQATVSVPEVRVVSRNSQAGAVKIGVLAYDAKTRRALGGGLLTANADHNSWFVLGAGPYQTGKATDEIERMADVPSGPRQTAVTFLSPARRSEGGRVIGTNGLKDGREPIPGPVE
jgi:hypothetical protein